MRNKKAAIGAWCLYDWANSAFPTIIVTFVFAAYFTKSVAINPIMGTSQWGKAIALAGVIIAFLSPVIGAIADREGQRKPWLALFTVLCIIASIFLWFTRPMVADVSWALTWMVVGLIAFEVGMVFYNTMLSDISSPQYLGRLSGWSWGLGYFGGLASLLIVLFVFHVNTTEQLRMTGPFVAIWFLVFAWPLFVWTPDQPSTGLSYRKAASKGLTSLYLTLKSVRQNKEIFKFILARIFYIDGLNTLFAFGGIYAAGTFGMSFKEIVEFGIGMNVSAGLGAIIFAWMDDFKGSKPTILLSLLTMMVCASVTLVTHSKLIFWIFGMGLSLFVGPVQAASRSLLIRLSPKEKITEMFGLYAFSGKATTFLGPWILAVLTLTFKSQRIGMSSVLVFMAIGFLILLTVRK